MKNSKFLFGLSAGALLLTAIMLFLTSKQIRQSAAKQNRIDQRIDSLNRANGIFSRKKDSLKNAVDSVRFNASKPIVEHSKL